jgi:hypothetical protein
MVGKFAKNISTVPFHRIRLSGARRLSQFGRWRETPTALRQFAPSVTINSVRSIAGDLRRPSSRVVEVQMVILFEIRYCRPSGQWSAKRTNLMRIEPFVRLRELRLHVMRRHRSSVLHGKPKYVAWLLSELSGIGKN